MIPTAAKYGRYTIIDCLYRHGKSDAQLESLIRHHLGYYKADHEDRVFEKFSHSRSIETHILSALRQFLAFRYENAVRGRRIYNAYSLYRALKEASNPLHMVVGRGYSGTYNPYEVERHQALLMLLTEQRDFDCEINSLKQHLMTLKSKLSGSLNHRIEEIGDHFLRLAERFDSMEYSSNKLLFDVLIDEDAENEFCKRAKKLANLYYSLADLMTAQQ